MRSACRCALLLLDEPFSALDAPLRAGLREALLALQGEIDATTILVTHDPAEAALLADELLLLAEGQVLQCGPAEAVFQRPVNEAAARLLGADNVAAGRATAAGRIDVGGVGIDVSGPRLTAGPVGWSVRPGSLRFVEAGGYPATVLQAGQVRAGQRRLLVRIGDAVLQAAAEPGHEGAAGPCRVAIDPAAIQAWPASPAASLSLAA